MKKIALSLLTIGSLAYADMATQEFLYKDPRIMGMGAANTAVGGYSTAVFYNPAGLINIKKEHGAEVELLGLTVSASANVKNLVDDLKNVDNNTSQVIDTVKKYSGDAFNLSAGNYSSFSYHTESDVAYSIGILAAADANLIPHANSGANGLLETHSRLYGGLMGAVAKKYANAIMEHDQLTVGFGLKYITQQSYEVGLDAGEVTNHKNDLATYVQNNYKVTNSGFGADIGILYNPFAERCWGPTFGLSVMNIGTLNFKDSYGAQPMTVNAGVSVSPDIAWFDSLKLAVDYVDIFNTQKMRVRNYNSTDPFNQYDNADVEYNFMQHIRAGASLGVVDNHWFLLTLNGGLYEGAYTAGFDMQLTILKLQFATYQEQLGAKPGQLEDRRYIVGLGIGW